MTSSAALPPDLVSILVDPADKESLWYFADDALLYNPRSRRVYEVRNGIPVLLVDEARQLDADEADLLEARRAEAQITGSA